MSISNRFKYTSFEDDQKARSTIMRAHAMEFAKVIEQNTATGREQSLALTKLEEAIFWLNSSIAKENVAQEIA